MALDDIIRGAVATAHQFTSSLQVTVQHYAWTGESDFGNPTYAAASPQKALVERKIRFVEERSGNVVNTFAKVTFLSQPAANGAPDRLEPVDPRDKIVLPDGVEGFVADTMGLYDPQTAQPYLLEVWLGRGIGAGVS